MSSEVWMRWVGKINLPIPHLCQWTQWCCHCRTSFSTSDPLRRNWSTRRSSSSFAPSRTDRTFSRKRLVSITRVNSWILDVYFVWLSYFQRASLGSQQAFIAFWQGMITLVLDCVDRLNVYNTAAHFSEYAGEEAAESWKEIVNLLYELLGMSVTYNDSSVMLLTLFLSVNMLCC